MALKAFVAQNLHLGRGDCLPAMNQPPALQAPPVRPPEPAQPAAGPVQRIIKVRRDYNSWVASETLEDYALRFTPQSFRKWSQWRVANTAFGAASFLILEAVGATLLVKYGFTNAFWAILATGLIIFMAGLPISIYAARYGLDMDLLTRGAGFGYIGSTLTSLIYASFTFIFFALEAAVMAYALELALGIPPAWGYLICALVVIPLVAHGVSVISRLQMWTQPIWLVMLVVPFVYVLVRDPGAFSGVMHYGGENGAGSGFDLHLFGAGLTVGIALITQMGEQADYLRFMPVQTPATRWRWWAGVLAGGPGWVLLGVVKMLSGVLLAYLAIKNMVPPERAVDPNQMYLAAYEYVFPDYGWAVAATAIFVVVSQLKINVTNAYAGSLAWSNFFSRLTHSHPGRVVWVVFNTLIAFMLMEMNVFQALGDVLGLYANVAIAWMMAVVADLVINKPLGLSPPGIEFKRAHLYDINPVGVGAMALASILSVTAHLGLFGPLAQAFSALIALGILDKFDVAGFQVDGVDSQHLQIEAMKLAFADVYKYVAEPASMEVTPEQMLDDAYLASRAKLIDMTKAQDFGAGNPVKGGTIYLTTADEDGMMVSFIQSNYMGFGSGCVEPEFGISLQNRGHGFSLQPGINQVAPGKRPFHTIIPAFLTKDGQPVMSYGVMGANMQPQGHMQTLVRMLDYGQNPQAACDAPRWRYNAGLEINVEAAMDPATVQALAGRGHRMEVINDSYQDFGAGQFIWRAGNPKVEGYVAASDPRRDGQAVGF